MSTNIDYHRRAVSEKQKRTKTRNGSVLTIWHLTLCASFDFYTFRSFSLLKRCVNREQKRKNRTSREFEQSSIYWEFDPLENSNRKKTVFFCKKKETYKFERDLSQQTNFITVHICMTRQRTALERKTFPAKSSMVTKVSKTYVSTSLVVETRIINVNHNVTVVLYHVLYSSLIYSYPSKSKEMFKTEFLASVITFTEEFS